MNNVFDVIKKNKYFIVGFVIILLYLFSSVFFGSYKLSYTNLRYNTAPFDSLGVATQGPPLSDVSDQIYPHLYKTFKSGEDFSFWNNKTALGSSSEDIYNLIDPLKYIYILPFDVAIFIKAVAELLIGFFAMYMYMRSISCNRFSSAMTGVVYIFTSSITVWFGWYHSDVALIAPLLFFGIEKLINTLDIKYGIIIALTVYMMLVVGMPTFAAYFLYLSGVYLLVYSVKRDYKNKKRLFTLWAVFALSIIVAVIMSMPYTYSLLSSVGSNGYTDSRENLATARLSLDSLVNVIYPYIRTTLDGHINESTIYAGMLPLLVIPFYFVNNKNKRKNIFFIVASVVAVLLIFTDGLNFIFRKLPTINTSLKTRVIVLLMFSLSVSTGISLNDFTENKEVYKKYIGIFALWAVALTAIAVYIYYSDVVIYTNSDYVEYLIKTLTVLVLLSVSIVTFVYSKDRVAKGFLAVLFLATAFNGTDFAKEYLPMIDKRAEVIPKATASIEYLEENNDNSRFTAVGLWTMYPEIAEYYGIQDLRTHNFVATNSDIKAMYEMIDPDCFITPTRVSFLDIKNYELLKYLGVKYIAYDLDDICNVIPLGKEKDKKVSIGAIPDYSLIEQPVKLNKGNIVGVNLLLSTYSTSPKLDSDITVELIDDEGDVLTKGKIKINEIVDNSYYNVIFNKNVRVKKGSYIVRLSFPEMGDETITLWRSEEYVGSFINNDISLEGAVVMDVITCDDTVTAFNDGIVLKELNEYADKAELAEEVECYKSQEDVLNAMSEKYIDNKAFVSYSGATEYNLPLEDNEKISLEQYDNDYIKINYTSNYDRLLLFNDYYNENWQAYLNGERLDVKRANYLTRGVEVKEGENMVLEMKYEPKTTIYTLYLLVFGLTCLILTCIFKPDIQKRIDRFTEGA